MYNAVTNDWQGVEKQITFDVRQPKTKEYSNETSEKIPGEPSVCGCGSFHDIFPSVHTDL